MLVASMNRAEISREILNDFDKIVNTPTLKRLGKEYSQERIKLHVKKEAEYVRYYELKSKAKNNWICILHKHEMSKKYQNANNCAVIIYGYYYTDNSICVYNVTDDMEITVYYGHLFARYRERMALDMPNLLDVVKYYMRNNCLVVNKTYPEADGKLKVIGILKEGYQLGDYDSENKCMVLKTFISNETANSFSITERSKCIKKYKINLLIEDPDNDEEYYQDLRNYLERINNEEIKEQRKDTGKEMPVHAPAMVPVIQKESDFVAFIKNQTICIYHQG
jgi:hypothetical protein